MIDRITHQLRQRSRAVRAQLEVGMPRMMGGWLALVALACALRIATSPLEGGIAPSSLLSFLLLAASPVVSALVALRWFAEVTPPTPEDSPRWKAIAPAVARRHPLYGASGLMASLLLGLLLSIVLRGAEYLAALPAISSDVPAWLSTLHFALSADVVLFTGLYAVAFVAALRHAPIFPLLLVTTWAADLTMQTGIAQWVASQSDVPQGVAVALDQLLRGNIEKLLISVALWLPYLLLSTRVNLTFRHRLPR